MHIAIVLSLSYCSGLCLFWDLCVPGERLITPPVLLHHSGMNPLQWPLSKAATLWDCQHKHCLVAPDVAQNKTQRERARSRLRLMLILNCVNLPESMSGPRLHPCMLVTASCPALTLLYSVLHRFLLFYFALISTCRGTFLTEPLTLFLVLSSRPSAWEICLISFIPLYCRVWCPPGRTHSWPSGSTGHSSGEHNMYRCCWFFTACLKCAVGKVCVCSVSPFFIRPHWNLWLQLASVILKQYVETHWCSQSEKFRPPETTDKVSGSHLIWPPLTLTLTPPPQAKAAIRELLPGGLREAISKVRSSVAYAISAIAHWDWPEAWPQLFTLLMEMLVSGDVNAVHGAMRVLTGMLWNKHEHEHTRNSLAQTLCSIKSPICAYSVSSTWKWWDRSCLRPPSLTTCWFCSEFTREVTDTQMPLVAPVILPEMYKIFTMAEVFQQLLPVYF